MADAASKTGIYEALLPAAYPVTETNRGAYVLLTAVIMIVITSLTVAVKVQITLSTFRKLRRDDVALLSALVFALAYTITICRAVKYGLGRAASELTSAQLRLLSQHYYAANILVWPSMACSKCAVALLVLALKPPRRWIVMALWAALCTAVAWGIAASFVFAFQCGPDRYTLGPTGIDSCIDQYGAQIGIRTADIASDLALSLLPAIMMLYVQTSASTRLVVSLMFATRLVTPIFAALALSRLAKFYDTPTRDRPFAAVEPAIWTCMALNASLLTACLPSVKRMLADWAAGVANAGIMEPFELQESTNRSKTGQLSGTARFSTSHQRLNSVSKAEQEVDGTAYAYYAQEGRDSSTRGEDTESKRRLTDGIVQTVDYSVEFEDKYGHGNSSSSRRS